VLFGRAASKPEFLRESRDQGRWARFHAVTSYGECTP
jgi:hypothetical protein